jgi:hypothetical protein
VLLGTIICHDFVRLGQFSVQTRAVAGHVDTHCDQYQISH